MRNVSTTVNHRFVEVKETMGLVGEYAIFE